MQQIATTDIQLGALKYSIFPFVNGIFNGKNSYAYPANTNIVYIG